MISELARPRSKSNSILRVGQIVKLKDYSQMINRILGNEINHFMFLHSAKSILSFQLIYSILQIFALLFVLFQLLSLIFQLSNNLFQFFNLILFFLFLDRLLSFLFLSCECQLSFLFLSFECQYSFLFLSLHLFLFVEFLQSLKGNDTLSLLRIRSKLGSQVFIYFLALVLWSIQSITLQGCNSSLVIQEYFLLIFVPSLVIMESLINSLQFLIHLLPQICNLYLLAITRFYVDDFSLTQKYWVIRVYSIGRYDNCYVQWWLAYLLCTLLILWLGMLIFLIDNDSCPLVHLWLSRLLLVIGAILFVGNFLDLLLLFFLIWLLHPHYFLGRLLLFLRIWLLLHHFFTTINKELYFINHKEIDFIIF